jgi:2-methylcitrate dehydratase PrpD
MLMARLITDFIHDLNWADVPAEARRFAHLCLLDTLGAAVAGSHTAASRSTYDFVTVAYGGQGAALWLDGRSVSPPGATLAHATTIDSLDIHDGYKPSKGHAGVAQVPATLDTLSLAAQQPVAGHELLATLIVGYEVALRAAVALHATACDYHSSGAWNALGTAAVTARRLRLNHEQTRHALGIGEYYGPRSQLMRCADHPTMVKDGSGWGAMTGVSAALLAARGFTGAPALTVEADNVTGYWQDLGHHWLISQQYFKPFAICYWVQPAVTGALQLQQQFDLPPEAIDHIRIFAFHEATHMTVRYPQNTDQAQYSLPFPVAAALVHGRLGPSELMGDALYDPRVLRLVERIEVTEDPMLSARFPAERLAREKISAGGRDYDSGIVAPRWATDPPGELELQAKFRWLAGHVLSGEQTNALEQIIWQIDAAEDAATLATCLAMPAAGVQLRQNPHEEPRENKA